MTMTGRRNDVHARSRAIDALSHGPSNLKARAGPKAKRAAESQSSPAIFAFVLTAY